MTEGNQTVNGDKTISGTTNLSTLTGSLPLKLSISKDIISQAINLASTEVTGVLPPANGGTGSSVILTDGQILIGNGTATPSAANISGTPNQITVFNGSGAIILSMPTAVILNAGSSINSASTLTIGDSVTTTLTLGRSGQTTSVASTLNVDSGIIDRTAAGTLAIGGTNVGTLSLGRSGQTTAILGNHTIAGTTNLSSGALTASLPLQLDASKNIISQAINIGTAGITGILPIANGGTNSATTLSNSRIMVSSSGSIVEAPALSNGMVAQTAANTFTARTITGTANQISLINGNGITGDPTISIPSAVILTGASSINSSSSTLAIGDSVTTTLTLGRAGQAVTVASTLNVDSGIIDRTAAGTLAIGGTNVTTLSLGRSGQTTAILGNHTIAGTTVASGSITLNAANELRFADSDSSNYVGFKSGATIASNVVWTLPTTDGTLDQALVTNGSGTTSWATLPRVEALDYFLTPPYNTQNSGAAATRVAQTSFEGAIYTLYRDVTFSKVGLRLTAFTAPGRLSMYFYQTPTGAASSAGSPAARVAGITSATPVSGVNTITLDSPGSATLKAGIVYVLWGRSSATGAFTLRTLSTLDMDLCNQNMITGTAPMTYSTGIAANTTPATFNAATQSSASSNDVTPILRLTNF
jgi:hypothetical protein